MKAKDIKTGDLVDGTLTVHNVTTSSADSEVLLCLKDENGNIGHMRANKEDEINVIKRSHKRKP